MHGELLIFDSVQQLRGELKRCLYSRLFQFECGSRLTLPG